MSQHTDEKNESPGPCGKLLHLGLLVFGLAAWLSGLLNDDADDHARMARLVFAVHSCLGMGLAVCAGLRLFTGIAGPRSMRILRWMPFTMARLTLLIRGIAGLFSLRRPDRTTHRYLAGAVKTFGLGAFSFMAATGVYLSLFLEPGHKARGFLHTVKELHEIGAMLVPMFLILHVGAVIMHALYGIPIWRKIFFISDTMVRQQKQSEALSR